MSDNDDPRPRMYAVMWDMHGLEAVALVPNPADATFALLKGEKPPEVPNLEHWKLRACYNTQRHYEIYIITVEPGIDAIDLREMFNTDPQSTADLIRSRGHCYYSNRWQEDSIVIR